MFSQYFGSYLLNKGYLTPKQLQRALELQDAVHLKLGILALNEEMCIRDSFIILLIVERNYIIISMNFIGVKHS